MNNPENHITVFEHEAIRFDRGEKRISESHFKTLQNYFGKGIPYYSLINNGVQFNEHVGVIQVGNVLIEVLPKADKFGTGRTEENKWRNILIGMLKAVGSFDIKATSDSNLKIKPNTILDLYFEMFIKEVEYLLHNGLLKKYRNTEGNLHCLKGSLMFSKHIQQNLLHRERFYVRYNTYDVNHKFHAVLYKTIFLLKETNTNTTLHGRIGSLLLHFPEMPDLKITAATFGKLSFNRKTQPYKKAIDIARLLLLQYHPDVSKGKNNVLALMFDMNLLWEQFVCASLRKYKEAGSGITAQTSKFFWKSESGYRSRIKPDIVIKDDQSCIVLDTKWKNLNGYKASPEDLRQMYVYHEYYKANKVALVYPASGNASITYGGTYLDPLTGLETGKQCSVISLCVESQVGQWQKNIHEHFKEWKKST